MQGVYIPKKSIPVRPDSLHDSNNNIADEQTKIAPLMVKEKRWVERVVVDDGCILILVKEVSEGSS